MTQTTSHGNPRFQSGKTAIQKSIKYIRRLIHVGQMDFEFGSWQMLYLLIAPQKVYRNFHYRKQTKDQYARDDPAFLCLMALFLTFTSVCFGIVMGVKFIDIVELILWVIFVDFIFC